MSEDNAKAVRKTRAHLDKRRLDVAQVFLVFCAFVGDCDRTAQELNLDPEIVRQLAKEEHWAHKLQRAVPSMDAKDAPKLVNRAINLIQAHRFRCMLEGVIRAFDGLTPDQILARLQSANKCGKPTISGRFMADIGAALEKAHHLSYAALGDTATERKTSDEDDDSPINAAALHAAVIRALSEESSAVPAETLVKQLVADIEVPSETKCPTEPKCLTEPKCPDPETPPTSC